MLSTLSVASQMINIFKTTVPTNKDLTFTTALAFKLGENILGNCLFGNEFTRIFSQGLMEARDKPTFIKILSAHYKNFAKSPFFLG